MFQVSLSFAMADWLDDEGDGPSLNEGEQVSNQLYQAGYRDGRAKGDEAAFQTNFDSGFERGLLIGRRAGELHAELQICVKNSRVPVLRVESKELERRAELVLTLLLNDLLDASKEESAVLTEIRALLRIFPAPVMLLFEDFAASLMMN